jgi:hypothetical protein
MSAAIPIMSLLQRDGIASAHPIRLSGQQPRLSTTFLQNGRSPRQ